MNRHDFKKLSDIRLREAGILLSSRQYSGAYYLGGYAVESGLKACIAKNVRRHEFPDRRRVNDSYTHDLERLVWAAQLESELNQLARNDREFDQNWTIVKDWNEGKRYERISRREALDLYAAITDSRHGVLQWLQRRW